MAEISAKFLRVDGSPEEFVLTAAIDGSRFYRDSIVNGCVSAHSVNGVAVLKNIIPSIELQPPAEYHITALCDDGRLLADEHLYVEEEF